MTDIDRLATLREIAEKLTLELHAEEGKDVAPLARELRATLKEISELSGEREASPVDDLAARREARRKAAGM